LKNKLLFFNKEGYPYNFEYDENDETYGGKLLFDENSNDTFKTIGLYLFEEVEPITYSDDMLLKKVELYNQSGISFTQSINENNNKIDNILCVNSSPNFYSKWIYGNNFDDLYPINSYISFNNMSFLSTTNDFDYNYYCVLENKPNAILIITDTDNETWDNTFLGGDIISHNIIKYDDYNNTLVSKITNYNFEQNKKLSISGSKYNDGIKTYINSAITNTYYQNWDTSGLSGDTFNLELTLYTERPKLYQGTVDFTLNNNDAILNFNNMSINLYENQQIIFEDYFDQPILSTNPIFTVVKKINTINVYNGDIIFYHIENENKTKIDIFNTNTNKITYDNYIKINGIIEDWDYTIKNGDILKFTTTLNNNTLKNIDREVSIKNIKYFKDIRIEYWQDKIKEYPALYNITKSNAIKYNNTINEQLYIDGEQIYNDKDNNQLSSDYIPINLRYEYIYFNEYIINDSNIYQISKLLSKNSNIYECTFSPHSITNTNFSKSVICYNISNIINLSKTILSDSGTTQPDYNSTINAFNTIHKTTLDRYGLTLYLNDNKIYLYSNLNTNIGQNMYFDAHVYINDNNAIDLTSGITNSKINNILINVNEILYNETILPSNVDSFDKNYHNEIMFNLNNDNNDYGFLLTLNNIEYYTKFINNTVETIDNFILTYKNIFKNIGVNLSSGLTNSVVYVDNYKDIRINYWTKEILNSPSKYKQASENAIKNNISINDEIYNEASYNYENYDDKEKIEYSVGQPMLIIDGIYPNVDISTLSVKVNIYSDYEILNTINNKSLFITGNELILNINSFYDFGYSTGMIINISGSKYNQNNKDYNIINISEHIIELSYQGLFFDDNSNITITSQKYLRKPRLSYNKDIYFSFKFDDIYDKSIFFYDISGEHLKPTKDLITGDYIESTRYIGQKPLWDINNECDDIEITLIDKPNDNINYINVPQKQQTVFYGEKGEYCLEFLLDEYDSTNINPTPEPLQVFIGYNNDNEGVNHSKIIMDLVDNTLFSGLTTSSTNNIDIEFSFDKNGVLKIQTDKNIDFINIGFEVGQPIEIIFNEMGDNNNHEFLNYGPFIIEYVNSKEIKIDINKLDYDITEFDTTYNTESYSFNIKVLPKKIFTLDVYGETEIEDERFRANLNNMGIDLNEKIEHIFPTSDINDDGIDYKLLNKKRKEMLIMYPEIYNYIGSYKALINAVNFFGWNGLELYEYYKNVNVDSDLYQKLIKVKIPDIFDNTVDGWTENDFIKGTYDTQYYKKTNLFNLTYNITDEHGNNIQYFSLNEMQTKLSLLKKWLKNNVIPLSTNLIDITGVVESEATMYHKTTSHFNTTKVYSSNKNTTINFNISETRNINKDYLLQIDFYTLNDNIPLGWTCKIVTYLKNNDGKLFKQQDFKLMKNDLSPYSFNINKDVDQYIFIETNSNDDYGFGITKNNMFNSSTLKNFQLINNNFNIPKQKQYLSMETGYYWFDENRYIWIDD